MNSVSYATFFARLNMFLRWKVRKDNHGVDFGPCRQIPPPALYIPPDVPAGRMASEPGLLMRRQDDWNAVGELTLKLPLFDRDYPVTYNFALFGISAHDQKLYDGK